MHILAMECLIVSRFVNVITWTIWDAKQ